ncbi:2-oxo-4-hydroxy-4-carboxy-5-ureidoimidazoline decarboxylase [Dietzia psychralcaliphila]|uniref:2-oxo-4-hydroxy-4-carboxy-5-ureidoimidazoline decarboxylase n=1 Tax=Dietzia psychralcaliphila TaxID=139021 RepID=UPI001C1DFC17|nr:2-oxo-4-hydroxy-4-carboxy-5-ureidoimidazoline decarboxylase [Dietzia psychralcaliphila]
MPQTTAEPTAADDHAVRIVDATPADDLLPVLTQLSGSAKWARAVLDGRPYRSREALHAAARRVLAEQSDAEVLAAVDAHPPIGAGAGASAEPVEGASAREQSAAATEDAELTRLLSEGQRRHAAHFGHAFLVCATGLTAREIVAELDRRIERGAAEELTCTREHLARINALRLDQLLDTGAL